MHRGPRPRRQLVLYDDTTRQIYTLAPQDQATGHLGDSVTVGGALQGNVIQVASIKMLTGIGLSVGQKAPDFFVSRPIWTGAKPRDAEGKKRHCASCFSVQPTGDLTVKASWSSCKALSTRFKKQGLKVAAISYDSEESSSISPDRRKIDFPLLADPDPRRSRRIRC